LKNSTLSEVQVPSPRGGDTAFSIVKEKPEEKNEVTKTLSHIKKFIAIQSPTEALRMVVAKMQHQYPNQWFHIQQKLIRARG